MKRIASAAIIALALSITGGAQAQASAPAMFKDGVLADRDGKTLYSFDKDISVPGKSACNNQCAANWPPFLASSSDKPQGDWGIITRDDMKKQWTYKKQPLYFWSKDKQPGERTGDGFANLWHVIKGQ